MVTPDESARRPSGRRGGDPKGNPLWRQFESLIARIERALAPSGAVVTAPDKIPPIAGGRRREVDASIRYTIGSTKILIAIECRRRGRPQGIEWLEQLRTKKESIGANALIAVASSGFAKRRADDARRLGLDLREINELKPEDVSVLLQHPGGTFKLTGFEASVEWDLVGGAPTQLHLDGHAHAELDPALLEALTQDLYDTPILSWGDTPPTVTIKQVIEAFRHLPDAPWQDQAPGTTATREFDIPLVDGLMVKTTSGLRTARALGVKLTIRRGNDPVAVDYYRYGCATTQRLVVEGAWTAPLGDQGLRMTLVQGDDGRFRGNIDVNPLPPSRTEPSVTRGHTAETGDTA